jgi:hypothetical protein
MTKNTNTTISKEELTRELNNGYLQGDYQKVGDLLKEHAAMFPPSIWNYNQGVLQYKQGNLPMARWYWEKAKWSDLQFAGVENNLLIAKEQLGLINIEAASQSTLSEYFESVGKKSDFALLGSALFILLLLIGIGIKVKRPLLRYSSFVLLMISAVCLTVILNERTSLTSSDQAVIVKEATLREGPSQVFTATGKIPAGLKVTLGLKQETWALIESPQEFYGWVNLSDLKMITTFKN